jgi:orotate phosphoribosyltransferase
MGRVELARQIRDVSKIRGAFRLRSGQTSNTYFDKYLFESEPKLLRAIAQAMMALLPAGTEVLCGLEMGGIPIATVLSQVTDVPAVFIRKAAKSYGTAKFAEGPPLTGKRLVLIEDVVSTGGALLDAASMLQAEGIGVSTAVCVIDRETGGREALARAGIELRALFTMTDIDRA